jgi:hypothetical protein
MPKLRYTPWEGKTYRSRGYRGRRLLILGESHYEDDKPEATVRYMNDHINGPSRYPFWSTIETVVSGRALENRAERLGFWNCVAFANMIQDAMSTANHRPTAAQWEHGRIFFAPILEATNPDSIFLFSKSLWNHLPDDREFPGSHELASLRSPHPDPVPAYLYRLGSRRSALAACFYHPSYMSRKRGTLLIKPWQNWASRLLSHRRRLAD